MAYLFFSLGKIGKKEWKDKIGLSSEKRRPLSIVWREAFSITDLYSYKPIAN